CCSGAAGSDPRDVKRCRSAAQSDCRAPGRRLAYAPSRQVKGLIMRTLLLSACLASLASPAWAEPSASLEGPTAGWRHDGLLDRSADARVAYPTPPIDRGGQRGRSLIAGKLEGTQGLRQPHTLAVNGNPLPLYTDAGGRFVRPY